MAELPVRPLPRGRHGLSRDEVATAQRLRMLLALADAMMDKGYVSTSVADVIKRAGVSRETFYQQFSSKLDCFMTAFEVAGEALIDTIEATVDIDRRDLGADDGRDAATRLAQFEQVFTAYLDALASQPGYARLFLVEVFAAGPEAIRRRGELEGRLVDILAALLGVGSEHGRFACEVLVAAIGAMVIEPLVAYDLSALRELRGPVVDLVRRAFEVDSC